MQLLPVAADRVTCYAGPDAVATSAEGLLARADEAFGGAAPWIDAQEAACQRWVARPGSATVAVGSFLLGLTRSGGSR